MALSITTNQQTLLATLATNLESAFQAGVVQGVTSVLPALTGYSVDTTIGGGIAANANANRLLIKQNVESILAALMVTLNIQGTVTTGGSGSVPGTLSANEVPTGSVNSTDGTNNNGTFLWAHAFASSQAVSVYVDGVRQPPTRYTLSNVSGQMQVVFNAGYNPIVGSYICADYYF